MFRPSAYEEMLAFEQRAWMGWEEPGNDSTERSPEKSERLADFMQAIETPEQREGEEY